ncbi:MAG: NAD(P)-binding domain-containing protein [Ruminococcus callidus]
MDTIGFIGVGNMGSAILKGIAGSSRNRNFTVRL